MIFVMKVKRTRRSYYQLIFGYYGMLVVAIEIQISNEINQTKQFKGLNKKKLF